MGCPYTAGETGPAALVGRDRELRQMLTLLDTMTAGRPAALVVEGPAASGRSRLLAEFGLAARSRGVTVLSGDEWVTPPAGPVLFLGDRPAGPVLFLGDRPARIAPRIWAALQTLGARAPLLVAVGVRTGADQLLVEQWPRVHRLRLAALSPGEVARLAELLLGAKPGRELLELCRVAAGRPGAVRELIAGLREEGLVRVVAGRAELTGVRLPTRIRVRLLNQVAALSPQARHLVQAATTLRSPFPLVRLTRLLQASPVVLIPAIDEVLESGLLTGDNEMLRFGHEVVRSAVESSLPRSVVAAMRHEQKRVGPSTPVPAKPAGREADWGLLTAREWEVAELVAEALTNQQIAGRLRRSAHTVNYHLRQIFQKLGITSRVELAALVRGRERKAGTSAS